MMENQHNEMVQPMATANLVQGMLQAENNLLELQLQTGESVRDIDAIYRTLRRRASPHPEERSSSRPRIIDTRPAQPEPDA